MAAMTPYARSRVADEPLLVGHLMATAPPRARAANAGSTGVSFLLHGGLLALAVYITALPPAPGPARETVSLIQLAPERAPDAPPPPPPPPPSADQPVPVVHEVYRGFQTLAAPTITPPDIPPPRAGSVVNEADYSGMGVEGGRAAGTVAPQTIVTAEDISAAPTFTPYSVAPELKNPDVVRRALVREYPSILKDAGITGRTVVWLFIDEHGKVLRRLVKQSSGMPQLDEAALVVAQVMEFTPAINHDRRVRVWVAQPLVFALGDE